MLKRETTSGFMGLIVSCEKSRMRTAHTHNGKRVRDVYWHGRAQFDERSRRSSGKKRQPARTSTYTNWRNMSVVASITYGGRRAIVIEGSTRRGGKVRESTRTRSRRRRRRKKNIRKEREANERVLWLVYGMAARRHGRHRHRFCLCTHTSASAHIYIYISVSFFPFSRGRSSCCLPHHPKCPL